MFEDIIIVIPSLNPDEKLKATVNSIKAVGFNNILVVNDGSDNRHLKYFPSPEDVTLLNHKVNRGKGAALKTAFRYIKRNMPEIKGIITADGDGQHMPEDIVKCAEALDVNGKTVILGCRDFSGPDVPGRSKFGNKTTSLIFKLLCGMKISDTQTGLRAFPCGILDLLCETEGQRFEYETNMLIKFKQCGISISEVKINTVYIEENKTSHFHPIKDSIRVYKFIFAYFISSMISFAADISLFYIFTKLLTGVLGGITETVATVGARIISSFINYSINKNKVFGKKSANTSTLLKYYRLAIPQMIVSALSVNILSAIFGAEAGAATVIKMVVDTILFFVSYRIQQNWVFADTPKKRKHKKQPEKHTKLTAKTVIIRSLISVGTALAIVLVTVISACLVIVNGPSVTLRNMLVISAKQASATKWLPGLFMSEETVNSIMASSEEINTDIVDASELSKVQEDEWENAIDGMQLHFIEKSKYKAYVLLVKDPSRVKVGVSSEQFASATAGKRIFEISAKYNAVAAINGGEFLDQGGMGSGARPMGLTYSMGKMVWNDNLKRTFMGFTVDNKLICRESMTQAEADSLGIRDAVSFQNGNVLIEQEGESVKLYYSDSNTGTAQRTAIGQRADGTVILLVTDGRSADSIGATKNDVIDLLVQFGAVNAGMLDGGSSAMMYYRDYYTKYSFDTSEFDSYQLQGLVNRYKAFTKPRSIPTYFIVTEEN